MNAGETAEELVRLIDSEMDGLDVLSMRIIANRILEKLKGWIPKQPQQQREKTMTYTEAKLFANKTQEFGKYGGWQFADIPTDYLAWLADQSRTLWRDLDAYLRSDLVKNS